MALPVLGENLHELLHSVECGDALMMLTLSEREVNAQCEVKYQVTDGLDGETMAGFPDPQSEGQWAESTRMELRPQAECPLRPIGTGHTVQNLLYYCFHERVFFEIRLR